MPSGWIVPVWPLKVNADRLIDDSTGQFVDHIKDGKTAWPEPGKSYGYSTGASKAGFRAVNSGRTLANEQHYAFFVEHAGNSPHRGVLAREWDAFTADLDAEFEFGLTRRFFAPMGSARSRGVR